MLISYLLLLDTTLCNDYFSLKGSYKSVRGFISFPQLLFFLVGLSLVVIFLLLLTLLK